jgi:multiple sugar transport system ATP-binding protein
LKVLILTRQDPEVTLPTRTYDAGLAPGPMTQGSTMAQIVLDHIDKVYAGGVKAIDGLSLEVKDGEFMVLVGPSGCGKSTALRSIAGLEEISSGTITIGDRVVNDLPPKDRDIAMVFQNYALYPHMTVEQNLAFGLQLRKTPKEEIKRRVNEAAKMLGLDQYLKRKPAALSGGQRQRVAMGRAIVREPQAFLMDEPLSNLDAKLRVSMRASLNQLHERLGVTTIYVTHDQVEAMTLGHRVCVMRDGRLQQVDTPQRLFESPVNLFVAGFIGSPAMNFVTWSPSPVSSSRCPNRSSTASRTWTATSAARSSWASGRPTSMTPSWLTRTGPGCR